MSPMNPKSDCSAQIRQMHKFMPNEEQDRAGQVCKHYKKQCVVSAWRMCRVGGGRLLDVSSAFQTAIFRVNESWNFRESYVALAVNVVWEVCGLTGHSDNSLSCSHTRVQLQHLPNRREIFILYAF